MIFERKLLTNPHARPGLRYNGMQLTPQWVCLHWTANEAETAGADAHYRYFENGSPSAKGPLYSSAHYVVDSEKIIQLVPDMEPANHIGDRHRKESRIRTELFAKAERHKIPSKNFTANYCGVIGIEMCVNGGVTHDRFTVMEDAALTHAAYLLHLHGLNSLNLIRHFDVTGKNCPIFYLNDYVFSTIKELVEKKIQSIFYKKRATVISSELNVRSGPGVSNPVVFKLQRGEPVLFDADGPTWQEFLPGCWINTKFVAIF